VIENLRLEREDGARHGHHQDDEAGGGARRKVQPEEARTKRFHGVRGAAQREIK
jgi:hypothetical protein